MFGIRENMLGVEPVSPIIGEGMRITGSVISIGQRFVRCKSRK